MKEDHKKNPWLLTKVVLPQNTDHAGVMWHGSYLRWLEESRISALYNVGLAYGEISDDGFEMPVIELQINYIKPLFHGDKALLKSWVSPGRGPRLHWETKILKDSISLAAVAHVDLVLIRRNEKGGRLLRKGPAKLEKALNDIQKGPKDHLF